MAISMSFFELARDRYSERNFDSRPVEQEKIDKILEAGRIVPTACNYQPQRFYVLKSEQALATAKTVTPFTYKASLMTIALHIITKMKSHLILLIILMCISISLICAPNGKLVIF